jgi:hypothetical protein
LFFIGTRKYAGMKKLFVIAVSVLFLVACENRRDSDGSTSKAPDNETRDTNESDNRDVDRTDDDRTSPIASDRDRDGDDRDGGILDADRDEENRIDRTVAQAGRSLFMSECASCHRVTDKDNARTDDDKKMAGPELTEITDRRNDRWLVKFMTNTDGRNRDNNDPEDVCMVQKNGKELNRDQALKVLEYLHMRDVENDANR